MTQRMPEKNRTQQAHALLVEQTKLLYAGLPNAITINALLALILVSVQNSVISSANSLCWLAIIGVTLLGRLALWFVWRHKQAAVDMRTWLWRFRVGVISTGFAWGAGAVLLFPADNVTYQVSLAFVLAGMSAGAVTLLAVDLVSMLGFLVPALAPLVVRFALEDNQVALAMSAMVALYLFFIAANAMGIRRSLLNNFRLRVRAQGQELVLRQSEMRLNQAQRTAHIGNWELDLSGNQLYWSDEIFRIFEIDSTKFEASYEAFLNAIHPEDRERVNRAYTDSLTTRKPYDIVHRLLFTDGRIKFVHERCETLFDAEGKPLRSLGTVQDITEQQIAVNALRESEARYRAVAHTASDAIVTADTMERIVGWNRGAERMFGYNEQEAIGQSLTMLIPPRYRERHLSGMARLLAGGKPHIAGKNAIELEGLRKDGRVFPLEMSLAQWESGERQYFTGIIRDITQRKQDESALRESEARFRFMLENSPIAARIADAATSRVVFANQRYADLINSTPDKVNGIDPAQYYANPHDYADVIERLGKGERVTNQLLELLIPNDPAVTKWALASYLLLEYQSRPAILGWFYDITDRKEMEEMVQHLAYHDPLTDLPNRMLFSDRLQQAMSIARRTKTQLALMFIDLDQFKPVNDTFGHNVGDLLLKEVAQRIRACLRESDTVGRIGGDEFVVLLPTIRAVQDALEVAEKIRHSLNRPFDVAGHAGLSISSSTGLAIYPEHGADEKELIKNADDAMYCAKAAGRNNVQIFRPGMSKAGGQA